MLRGRANVALPWLRGAGPDGAHSHLDDGGESRRGLEERHRHGHGQTLTIDNAPLGAWQRACELTLEGRETRAVRYGPVSSRDHRTSTKSD